MHAHLELRPVWKLNFEKLTLSFSDSDRLEFENNIALRAARRPVLCPSVSEYVGMYRTGSWVGGGQSSKLIRARRLGLGAVSVQRLGWG